MRVSAVWAALAAIGASTIFSALASAILTAVVVEPLAQGGWFQHLSGERIVEWSGLVGGAIGIMVAIWRGGSAAAVLFLVYLALVTALAIAGAVEYAELCLYQLGCLADVPWSAEEALARQAPSLVGVAAGGALALAVRRLPLRPAYALEAVGVYSVMLIPLAALAGVRDPRFGPVTITQSLPMVPAVLVFLALPVAAGVVITMRSPTPTRTAVQLAALTAAYALPPATSSTIHGGLLPAALMLIGVFVVTGAVTLAGTSLVRRVGVAGAAPG